MERERRDIKHRMIDAATSVILKILKHSPDGLMTRTCQLLDFGLPLVDLAASEELKEASDLTNKGYIPVVALNHQSHADILVMAIISKLIMESVDSGSLNGFLLPYAVSASSGHQGEVIQEFFYALKPWLLAHGITLFPVVRAKDTEKYHIQNSAESIETLRNLYRAHRMRMGITIVPEGTVQGGRKNGQEDIYGMVEPEDGLGRILNNWIGHKIPFFVLPVGVNGTFNLLSPDTLRPTAEALKAFVKPAKLAQVRIGMPLISDDIASQVTGKKGDCDVINSLVMHHIAALVPPQAQGIYRTR